MGVEYPDGFVRLVGVIDDCGAGVCSGVSVTLLGDLGPHLGFLVSSGVHGSRRGNLRDLQVQHAGHPYRILFAFEPHRYMVLLLLGGTRPETIVGMTKNMPIADRLYDEYLVALRKEGLKDG
jgi:hypothetical protein